MKREISRLEWTDRRGALTAPITLAVAADLHNEPFDDLLAPMGEADAILIPGDVVNRHDPGDQRYARDFLRVAARIAPTFLSIGNHETALREKGRLDWLDRCGAAVLDDSAVRLREDVLLGGLTSMYQTPSGRVVEEMAGFGGFRLLMCHHPEYYGRLIAGRGIDLTLSGHAHGGQFRLFGRGLFAPGQGLFPRLTSGFYEDGRLLVSRGLGNHERIPRINNPCELILLTLRPGGTGA